MMKMNAVFYLALMFGLGACGVLKTEPMVNEDEIDAAGAILREIFKLHQVDGTSENSVLDTESQNEKTGIDALKNDNLTCGRMRCCWHSNVGGCNLYPPNAAQLQIAMQIYRSGMIINVLYKHHVLLHIHFPDGGHKVFNFRIGYGHYQLAISERRINCAHVTVCFKITVSYRCRRWSYNFGCTSNIYKVTESQPVKGVASWNSNLKNCVESEDVDSVKTENVENFIESNQNENSLKWVNDA